MMGLRCAKRLPDVARSPLPVGLVVGPLPPGPPLLQNTGEQYSAPGSLTDSSMHDQKGKVTCAHVAGALG